MQKLLSSYTEQVENKLFQFICEPDASVASAKDFLFRVIKWLGDLEAYHQAQVEKAKAQLPEVETPVTDEVKEEVAA